MIMFDNDKIFS